MISPNQQYLITSSLMENFFYYLVDNKKISLNKAFIFIKSVRKFQNYIGKSFVDIEQKDINEYLNHLTKYEHLKYDTTYRHLTAIRRFYEYLHNSEKIKINPTKRIKFIDKKNTWGIVQINLNSKKN